MTKEQRAEALEIVNDYMIRTQSSIDANLRKTDRESAQILYNISWVLHLLLEEEVHRDQRNRNRE